MDKKIIRLSIACAVLLVTWLVGLITSPEVRSARAQTAKFNVSLTESAVARIEIDDNTLVHSDGTWYRTLSDDAQVPARSERIDALFDNIKNIRGVRKIAENAEVSDNYGLAIGQTLNMYDSAGNLLINFVFGLPVAGFKAVYATSSVQPGVLSIGEDLAFYARQDEFYWTDLRLFPDRPDLSTIERVDIQNGENSFALVLIQNDSETASENPFIWAFEDEQDTALDQVRAKGIVRTIINLEGSDVSPAQTSGEVLASVTAKTATTTYLIKIFENSKAEDSEVDSFLANPSLGNQGYYYSISEAVRDRLIRDREYFTE